MSSPGYLDAHTAGARRLAHRSSARQNPPGWPRARWREGWCSDSRVRSIDQLSVLVAGARARETRVRGRAAARRRPHAAGEDEAVAGRAISLCPFSGQESPARPAVRNRRSVQPSGIASPSSQQEPPARPAVRNRQSVQLLGGNERGRLARSGPGEARTARAKRGGPQRAAAGRASRGLSRCCR